MCTALSRKKGIHGAQNPDEPITDFSGRFMLHPVADIIDFEPF
jgi:hypothetical protein